MSRYLTAIPFVSNSVKPRNSQTYLLAFTIGIYQGTIQVFTVIHYNKSCDVIVFRRSSCAPAALFWRHRLTDDVINHSSARLTTASSLRTTSLPGASLRMLSGENIWWRRLPSAHCKFCRPVLVSCDPTILTPLLTVTVNCCGKWRVQVIRKLLQFIFCLWKNK